MASNGVNDFGCRQRVRVGRTVKSPLGTHQCGSDSREPSHSFVFGSATSAVRAARRARSRRPPASSQGAAQALPPPRSPSENLGSIADPFESGRCRERGSPCHLFRAARAVAILPPCRAAVARDRGASPGLHAAGRAGSAPKPSSHRLQNFDRVRFSGTRRSQHPHPRSQASECAQR